MATFLWSNVAKSLLKGRPIPTLLGAFVGCAVGLSFCFILFGELACDAIAISLISTILGSLFSAMLFKRRTPTPTAPPYPIGRMVRFWLSTTEGLNCLIALLENAVYVVFHDDSPWDKVLKSLERGEDPRIAEGDMIRLSDVTHIEMDKTDSTSFIYVYYAAEGRSKWRTVQFQHPHERDEFLAGVGRHFGIVPQFKSCPMNRFRSMTLPLVFAILVLVFTSIFAWLASHWIEHPPTGAKKDEFYEYLTWAGPLGVALAGSLPLIGTLTWMILRYLKPPMIQVLKIQS